MAPMPTARTAAADLYWIPLGAGGHSVRFNGRVFEAIEAARQHRPRCDLYHAALVVGLDGHRYAIEIAPSPDADEAGRGVVATGPVGSRYLGWLRLFRYEVRCWRDGLIPDLGEAVGQPLRLTTEPGVARRLVELAPKVPTPVWGRDELHAGEMWNSNSVIAWLIASAGLPTNLLAPPPQGRAPGWAAGVRVAGRNGVVVPAAKISGGAGGGGREHSARGGSGSGGDLGLGARPWGARRLLAALAVAAVACLGALPAAEPAEAARPGPGSFFGFPGTYARAEVVSSVDVTTLRVARSRRSFPATTLAVCATRMRVAGSAGRAAAVPIRRDGRFAAVGRDGPARYRVRGRFIARDEARIRVTRRSRLCGRIVLYRNGVPPFRGCAAQPAVTLSRSRTGRVLQQMTQDPGQSGFSPHVYGCLFESPSKRFDLGRNVPPDETLGEFRFGGPMLAFFRGGCIGACFFDQRSVEARDLRDGGLVRRPEVPDWSRLYDLAVNANGSLGWTLDRLAIGPNGDPVGYPNQPPVVAAREVWAADSTGQRLLDSGPDVVLDSLEINGSTLYWLNGAGARSATVD
ncbi:MAG TPA: hypothetical protein VFM57_10470 [Thermoleophilaceae bacterium]|nr:hypothetical protein [Thermoleophilaceae bacterium]